MKRVDNCFILDESDVESAVLQFICACHEDVAADHVISVYNHTGCTAIAFNGNYGCGILEAPEEKDESGKTVVQHTHGGSANASTQICPDCGGSGCDESDFLVPMPLCIKCGGSGKLRHV